MTWRLAWRWRLWRIWARRYGHIRHGTGYGGGRAFRFWACGPIHLRRYEWR